MAASNTMYNLARQALLQGGINWVSDTIKCALLTSAYTPSQAHNWFSDVSGSQVGTTNTGYSAGGATLGTKSVAVNGSNYTARAAATQWTAGTAGLTARYAVVYKDTGTPGSSQLICYVLLDTTPADVTATNGGTFTITWDTTAGVFYV